MVRSLRRNHRAVRMKFLSLFSKIVAHGSISIEHQVTLEEEFTLLRNEIPILSAGEIYDRLIEVRQFGRACRENLELAFPATEFYDSVSGLIRSSKSLFGIEGLKVLRPEMNRAAYPRAVVQMWDAEEERLRVKVISLLEEHCSFIEPFTDERATDGA